MGDRIGQQLGNYRLIRELGRGGFATVYLGEHLYLKTQAAVKVLDGRLAGPYAQDFTKEAQIIAALKHPHILRVLDFGFDGSTPFLVMEVASQGTLRDRHPRGSVVPPLTVVAYVRPVAAALQYAHERKVIHRDVKPENLLVNDQQQLLLSDFGIASIAHSTASMKQLDSSGTPHYMAPEQFEGHSREASDQYALAIVVYEWLTGQRPFQGDNWMAIGMQHLSTPVPSLREKNPAITLEVEQVVLKALAKDSKQRFESIQAFAYGLERACLPSAVQEKQPSKEGVLRSDLGSSTTRSLPVPLPSLPLQQSQRGISRRAIVSGLVGLAVVAATGASIILLTQAKVPPMASHSSTPTATASPAPTQPPTVTASPAPTQPPAATASPAPTQPPATQSQGTTLFTYRGHSNNVTGVTWSPNSSRVASASDDYTVQAWDASNGGNVLAYRGQGLMEGVAWSPDSRLIASGGVQVWDAATGKQVYTYSGHSLIVYGVAWSPNSLRVASASADGTVQVWDATTGGHVYIYRGHSNGVNGVAWSPNSSRIASASTDETVQVWDATTGGHVYIYRGHSNGVMGVAWSPNGSLIASASTDGTVQVWDATTGSHVYTYSRHYSDVRAVAWSPSGLRIASASNDGTVQVWDATTGGHGYIYRGHSRAVNAVAWSPNGSLIASASTDGTVQVWQAG